ncbi:hypothetical protein CPAR01_00076 [Colletotrichum paranaense]|uniref:Uncharacterized protein n=1 Tax=Colletotrichum paranaense TaxID=1914294 RepID=A0ABQ9T2U8_9PEZI|nr:uncharacterized protein CPAR01_00076 [Colletotrichum paranaense]KAK1546109.1 hypothetical protein CPAR01_00076 [Colletotrichum paranaense]
MASPSPSHLTPQVHFLARDPKYEHEKLYTLRYIPSPTDDLSQTNIDRVQHEYDDYAYTGKIEKIHAPKVMVAVKLALGVTCAGEIRTGQLQQDVRTPLISLLRGRILITPTKVARPSSTKSLTARQMQYWRDAGNASSKF